MKERCICFHLRDVKLHSFVTVWSQRVNDQSWKLVSGSGYSVLHSIRIGSGIPLWT
jgi:hypothetical protein